MLAFKGFTKDLTATSGKGEYKFVSGKTYTEESSFCARKGFHCAEYPLDCLSYYHLNGTNRYFLVEAAGSIDEKEGDTKIACTEITLLRELTIKELAAYGMKYMIEHPLRDWEKSGSCLQVAADEAVGGGKNSIAIARGVNPRVKGAAGSALGLLIESAPGTFENARVFEVAVEIKPNTWYRLNVGGELEEVTD